MPARLRDIKRAAGAFGVEIEKPRSGSHWKCRREGCRVYPIPAGNGLKSEVDDVYIRGLCRNLGIDLEEFMAALRK